MRRALLLLPLILLTACVRSASTESGAQAAASDNLCRAADFTQSSSVDASGEQFSLGLTLIYNGSVPCSLSNLPLLALTDTSGAELSDISYRSFSPTDAPQAPVVKPGEGVIAIARWQNYCADLPAGGVLIRVDMPGGGSIRSTEPILQAPACLDAKKISIVETTPYTFPP